MNELHTDNADIQTLLPRLGSSDSGVRRIALIDLADLEDPDGLPFLIHVLGQDNASEVRSEAARLLEGWEEEEVVSEIGRAHV